MNQTSNLGLILPAPNSTCWGADINQNFTDIDNSYAALSNQVAALRSQLGQVGIYYSDPKYTGQLVLVYGGEASDGTRPVTKAYTQELNSDGSAGDQVTLYDGTNYLLNNIIDFTMLVITIPTVAHQGYQFSMGGSLWSHGDIAVKITTYDVSESRNVISLRKMSQTIGGYYRPDHYKASSGLPRTLYRRENAVQSTVEYLGPSLYVKPVSVQGNQITFDYCTTTTSGNETSLGKACTLTYPQIITKSYTTTYTQGTVNYGNQIITTGISTSDYVVLDVAFFTEDEEKRIFADYYVRTEPINNTYYINLVTIYFSPNTKIIIRVSYADRQDG